MKPRNDVASSIVQDINDLLSRYRERLQSIDAERVRVPSSQEDFIVDKIVVLEELVKTAEDAFSDLSYIE